MHELGITRSIVEIAEKSARQEQAKRVTSLTVEIGGLSGVIPEAVEFAFAPCAEGTLLEGARLVIDPIPGRARCNGCGKECAIDRYTFACPACDACALEVLQGEELRIKEMEID